MLARGLNPFWRQAESALFLAWEGARPVGRIGATRRILAGQEAAGARDGFFGFFESIADPDVARALLTAAADWLRERGCTRLLGPCQPTPDFDGFGLLVEGFDARRLSGESFNHGAGVGSSVHTPLGWARPMSDPHGDPLRKQERAIFLSFLLALGGFLPTALVAVFSGSILLMSDLPAYARGLFTTFMGWEVLRSIRRGRIHGYDYGTDKIQSLAAIVGSLLYLGTLGLFGAWAIGRLFAPAELDPTFTFFGLLIQLVDCAVSAWLWRLHRNLARLQVSPVMEMQWRAYRGDTLLSLALAISLALTLLLDGFSWSVYLDPILALIFIAYVGLSFLPVLANDLNDLLDKTLREDLQLRINRRLAEHFNDYTAFHGVRSRRAGGRIFIDLALSFDPDTPTASTLDTVRQLREKLEGDIPGSEVRVVLIP